MSGGVISGVFSLEFRLCHHQHAKNLRQCFPKVMTMHDLVDHAFFLKIFGALKPFGQLFANCVFDHARPGKADKGAGFRQMYIAKHGVTRRDPARGRIAEHDNIGEVIFAQSLNGDGRSGHLHQR